MEHSIGVVKRLKFSFSLITLFILTLLAGGHAIAAKKAKCTSLLIEKVEPLTRTEELISYLSDLYAHKTIREGELESFLKTLEEGRLANPINEDEALTSTKLAIHREGLEQLLLKPSELDQAELMKWVRSTLKLQSKIEEAREQTQSETTQIHQTLQFVAIPPGEVVVSETQYFAGTTRAKAHLTHNYEVLSTPLTQKQWVELFGENPSQFKDGTFTVVVTINGHPVKMQPDNPVESITWASAVIAANRFSELHGLKPVYDTSEVVWKDGTRAENGTLRIKSGRVKINAPDGNIYLANGYRLPTEVEQINLISLEKIKNSAIPIDKRAWHQGNANGATNPVASLEPLVLNDKKIYDITGNVFEWANDYFEDETERDHYPQYTTGEDPTGPPNGFKHPMRGGSFESFSSELSKKREARGMGKGLTPDCGVRFVRTLK